MEKLPFLKGNNKLFRILLVAIIFSPTVDTSNINQDVQVKIPQEIGEIIGENIAPAVTSTNVNFDNKQDFTTAPNSIGEIINESRDVTMPNMTQDQTNIENVTIQNGDALDQTMDDINIITLNFDGSGKRYFKIDQHLARHFVYYVESLSSPSPFLYR